MAALTVVSALEVSGFKERAPIPILGENFHESF
jgi:hypothetical protein